MDDPDPDAPSASGAPLGKSLRVFESLTGSFLEAFSFLSGSLQSQAVQERRESIRENLRGVVKENYLGGGGCPSFS